MLNIAKYSKSDKKIIRQLIKKLGTTEETIFGIADNYNWGNKDFNNGRFNHYIFSIDDTLKEVNNIILVILNYTKITLYIEIKKNFGFEEEFNEKILESLGEAIYIDYSLLRFETIEVFNNLKDEIDCNLNDDKLTKFERKQKILEIKKTFKKYQIKIDR